MKNLIGSGVVDHIIYGEDISAWSEWKRTDRDGVCVRFEVDRTPDSNPISVSEPSPNNVPYPARSSLTVN